MNYRKDIETKYSADVLVLGGGPAGLCAALAAARGGAQTILAEKNAFCGGMATAGLVAPFMTCYDSGGETQIIKGIFEEIVERLCAVGGALHPSGILTSSAYTSYITKGHIHVTPFKAEALKKLADDMLTEAGVKILYHTAFVDTQCCDGYIKKVVLHQKNGLVAADAKVIIDCTGDADVAASAGVPYTLGNPQSGRIQPASMFFTVGNVDSKKVDADIEAHINDFYRKDGVNYRSMHWWVSKAREAGDWSLNRVSIGLFKGVEDDEWSINTSRIMNIDGTDSESLTEGEIIGRAQVDEIFKFLKKYVPGFENAKLIATGSTLGIRETRHIKGRQTLTLDSLLECKIPEDSVVYAANSIDVHGKFGPTSNEYITLPEGKYYGIPYECFVPESINNLLVAGRALSADSDAAGAVRVMPPCMAMGEAVGVAAALSVKNNVDVCDCNVKEIREVLRANEAL